MFALVHCNPCRNVTFTHRFKVPCYIKSFQPVLLTAFCASARQPSPFLLWWVSAGRLHGSSDVISLPCRVTLHDSVHRMLIVVASSVSRPSSPFRSLFPTPPHPLSAPPCWQFDFGVSALCWRPVSGASSYFKGRMKMPSLAGSRIFLSEIFFFCDLRFDAIVIYVHAVPGAFYTSFAHHLPITMAGFIHSLSSPTMRLNLWLCHSYDSASFEVCILRLAWKPKPHLPFQ